MEVKQTDDAALGVVLLLVATVATLMLAATEEEEPTIDLEWIQDLNERGKIP